MIGYLSGTIVHKRERQIILDVNGVGYLVSAARQFIETLKKGDPCSVFIYTQVREDELSLYGFKQESEWDLFKLLLTVSGVGPKVALEIMNAQIEKVRNAIAHKDPDFLKRIPGIGKKTAERIIVDLQNKVTPAEVQYVESKEPENVPQEDIINALVALGYTRQHVMNGLRKLPSELTEEEAIIKYFLQNH
ncbi:Holliday junction branch migration protein RuvA [Candidatus Gracilibacteria bacterium]|nr:Holliday junction branch migration protein RuvA [Candidatus Gracilibacteria bacterium]